MHMHTKLKCLFLVSLCCLVTNVMADTLERSNDKDKGNQIEKDGEKDKERREPEHEKESKNRLFCNSLSGASYGICNAYCQAMKCNSSNQSANNKACMQKLEAWNKLNPGVTIPCENVGLMISKSIFGVPDSEGLNYPELPSNSEQKYAFKIINSGAVPLMDINFTDISNDGSGLSVNSCSAAPFTYAYPASNPFTCCDADLYKGIASQNAVNCQTPFVTAQSGSTIQNYSDTAKVSAKSSYDGSLVSSSDNASYSIAATQGVIIIPSSYNFGCVLLGSSSSESSFVLTNNTNGDIFLNNFDIAGGFNLNFATSTCLSLSSGKLIHGQSCTMKVAVDTNGVDGPLNGILRVDFVDSSLSTPGSVSATMSANLQSSCP